MDTYEGACNKLETALLNIEGTEKEMDNLQNEYFPLCSHYERQLAKLKSLEQGQSGTTDAQANTVSVMSKLLSVKLPVFRGELSEYESFIDQFEAQIGRRQDLEPVTKLHYLKSQLTGRALDLIKGYTSISGKYTTALETLKET